MDEVSRVIGALEANQQAQKEQHAALAERVDQGFAELNAKVDQLLATQHRQRGARKVLGALTVGGGTVGGAIIGWVVTWITSGPKHP